MVWTYIILSYLSLFALGFADNVRGPIYPEIISTFNLDHTMGSFMFTISSFMGFAGGILIHNFLKKMNMISALQLSLLLMTVGLLGMGGATSFPLFLAFAGTFGLSMGFLGVLQNLLVALGSTPDKKQQFLAGLHSMYGLASLLSPLVVSVISKFAGDWRMACYVVALVPFSVLVASFMHTIRGWRPPHEGKEQSRSQEHPRSGFAMFFLAMALGFYVLVEILVSTRVALLFREVESYDLSRSSQMTSYFFISIFIGRLFFTFFRTSVSVFNQMVFSLLSSIVLFSVGMFLNLKILIFSGFTLAPFFSLSVTYLSDVFKGHEKKAISYLVSIQSILIFIMHFLTGWLTDIYGIKKVYFLAPILLGLSMVMLLYFDKSMKKNLGQI